MRKKKLGWNTISSLGYQIIAILCGFILPRVILQCYGTEVNGVVNSITHFLQFVAFFELGVGAVVQSSLYKPLADKDDSRISAIIVSASRFFDKLALILVVYIAVLIVCYPILVSDDFDWMYSATLIIVMSISSFAQYYFGVVDRLLLTADQRGYIQYNAQSITLVLNTIISVVLIWCGASIHVVKLVASIIYLARPIVLRLYVNYHYSIDRKIELKYEPIEQKWNGAAQHIAVVVLNSTDTMVLTVFSTLANVSIYSVYYYVIYGVKQMFTSTVNGVQSLLGELWARREDEELSKIFGWIEWAIHTGTTVVFGCTGVLIVSFVRVYTKGVTDANYVQPLFAVLLTLAHACHCLRIPYHIMILAAGHYKQTQNNYVIATLMNIILSIATVRWFGLVGVAIGTLVAMLYQTIWMAVYNSKNFISWPLKRFFRQLCVDAFTAFLATILSIWIKLPDVSYLGWGVMACQVVVVWLSVTLGINFVFYRDKIGGIAKKILKKRPAHQSLS